MEFNTDIIWLIILIVVVALTVSKRKPVSNRFHGGIHVKPKTNTPKPKVKPAPQTRFKQNS